MLIERRIVINNKQYFLGFKLKYNEFGILKKEDDSYFDMGDLSIAIDYFEKNYAEGFDYDKKNSYMNDILYLYDRFPFVAFIKDIIYDKEGKISQIFSVDKEEIIKYINNNNIKLDKWNKEECPTPLLYN